MKQLYRILIFSLTLLASRASAQFVEDSTETNQEGFILYGSHLSFGLGYFQAEGFATTPGLAYEAGVTAKYQRGNIVYDVSLFASSRCASIPEARVDAMRLTYLMIAPSIISTQGLLSTSLGVAVGLPIRAGSRTHTEVRRLDLSSVGGLYEMRGKLQLDLTRWLPFGIYATGTFPLATTGLIDVGDHTVSGRSSTLQFGLTSM
jgi:hypothetical protein